ncbi:hypothetical protein [Mucilaginibacter psychrotolerans]|uniref:Uncharacterized protein n=1 Tax=Mucilaginibacter psychrotolerans TaxID=1524096 RepID=A0A4Y8S6F3_9SPHI|nr:hypothetical protein [Mucilaginibacter psychrotolerans]TFF34326.1 hypothetical protein E2R66_22595 [Mucilaginibacter psychrotolerans]
MPRDWVPLYLYKGKYYVYKPSEPGELARRIITDSTVVYWWMDGPEVRPLQRAVKMKNGGLSLQNTLSFDMHASNLNIYVIDPKLNITVFEDTAMPDAYRYSLYIPKESIKYFDLIVNYCETQKVGEFEFDKPDFKRLLVGHK